MPHKTDAILPPQAPEIILERFIPAPRALVFRCFMDPTHLSRWWGPGVFTCPVCEVEARVGGAVYHVLRDPKGNDYALRATITELVPEQRIVREEDLGGHPQSWFDTVDPERKGEWPRTIGNRSTFTFADHEGGTKLTLTTRFDTVARRNRFAELGFIEGWSEGLDRLENLANALKEDPRVISMSRLIAVPVERVFKAFADPKGLAIWWGPNGFTTTTYEMNFAPGGVWRYTMHGPDGTDYPNYVSYTAIEPNSSITYDHGTDAANPQMFKAAITFTPEGGSTRVTIRLTLKDAAERPHYVGFGAVEGGYQNLARLEAFLTEKAGAAA